MKFFCALVITFFSSTILAESLYEFEIEGISIGDSLLQHFSLKDINNNLSLDYYTHKTDPLKFIVFGISKDETFLENFDRIEMTFKSDDSDYIIHSLNGGFFFDDVNECLITMIKYLNNINQTFPNLEQSEIRTHVHSYDSTGESEVTEIEFYFNDGDLDLECYDWSEKITNSKGFYDNFQISAQSDEFISYLYQD